VGYVVGQGTQHNPEVRRTALGVPTGGAGTLAVTGDLKQMTPEFVVGVSFMGYGVSLAVGLGVPIPILDEEVMRHAALGDEDLVTQVVDYSHDYPEMVARSLGEVSYAQLRSGSVTIQGREVPTVSLSSYAKARTAIEISISNSDWPDLMERQERVIYTCILLVVAGLFGAALAPWFNLLEAGLWVLAALTHATAIQRFLRARRLLLSSAKEKQPR